jgi:hypothetical protein
MYVMIRLSYQLNKQKRSQLCNKTLNLCVWTPVYQPRIIIVSKEQK